MAIIVEVYVRNAPNTLDPEKLKQYIDAIIARDRGQSFATTTIIVSKTSIGGDDTVLEPLTLPDNTPVVYNIPGYSCDVRFRVNKIPDSNDDANYLLLHKIVEKAFEHFCSPLISVGMDYIVDTTVSPFSPANDKDIEIIETDVKALMRKVNTLSKQMEIVLSKL